ncbi:SRPBCC family protein [Streptomyces palmae]|uniref:SRPBCC family protein n=1 Tax=Streptomyces palmae TaxID=1701085 RepID=A0A4Z0GYG9_9ACTN|nr:SRPBCC family protein [Streptomyces palmae]TGB01736.1 SRPBCC family protein [Streptomyces palmae]
MRLSDQPGTEAEIRIEAAVSRVWDLVSDIALPARLSPELQRVEWLNGATGPAVGARFTGHNTHPRIGEWQTVAEVVEYEPERAFGWAVIDAYGRYGEAVDDAANPMATWRFRLDAAPDGTLLRQSMRIGTGRSGLTVVVERWPDKEAELIGGRLDEVRAGMEATLRGIKALAEDND